MSCEDENFDVLQFPQGQVLSDTEKLPRVSENEGQDWLPNSRGSVYNENVDSFVRSYKGLSDRNSRALSHALAGLSEDLVQRSQLPDGPMNLIHNLVSMEREEIYLYIQPTF